MNLIKKILIVVILVIFTYIVWRLLRIRMQLKAEHTKTETFTLFGSSADNELASLKNSEQVKIENCNKNYGILPLREFCIKTSYNTALTGKYVNLDMISYILHRGCRFIDFEIFYISETTYDEKKNPIIKYSPRVAYSIDNSFTTINSENSLSLNDVLSTVVNNAFSMPCPNIKDPLFINLRIKSNNKDVYKAVASAIDITIGKKLYVDTTSSQTPYPAIKLDRNTVLSDIMGKIIICMDKTIVREYKDYTNCDASDPNCYNLNDYVNVETGGELLNLLRYSEVMDQCTIPIHLKDDNLHTDIKTMKYVIPNTKNDNSKNPDFSDFVLKYSCQNVGYRFYKKDKDLQRYEDFFNDTKGAFIPLAIATNYFKKMIQ